MSSLEQPQRKLEADPAKVAKDGWSAMLDGKDSITSGLLNKLQVAASGVASVAVMAEMHRKMAEPGTGTE